MLQPAAVITSRNSGKLERLASMNDTVVAQLNSVLAAKATESTPRTALAVGLTKALCYIMATRARLSRTAEAADAGRNGDERIAVLSTTASLHDQYIPTMNCIFAAQKEKVIVDTCLLSGSSALLQQAAALSGGTYTEVSTDDLPDLLHHLIAVLLPDREDRTLLQLPVNTLVDFRAACFCHGNAIDQYGFVCSECFSGKKHTRMYVAHA